MARFPATRQWEWRVPLKDEEGQPLGVSISNLLIANSSSDLPVIDLTRVSQELAYLASDAELVILEGMGSSSLYSLLPTYNKILFKNLNRDRKLLETCISLTDQFIDALLGFGT
ncbi:hypothetical protein D0Y65_043564 [Glycine soja]|uniref:Pantothenate kinase 2 n=1 Tax=Glycine soja TaxID=3848 RepID=A0A445GI09_GLYSO|nr:hypothetical protein D0Y65_043564 [Glycine soja]